MKYEVSAGHTLRLKSKGKDIKEGDTFTTPDDMPQREANLLLGLKRVTLVNEELPSIEKFPEPEEPIPQAAPIDRPFFRRPPGRPPNSARFPTPEPMLPAKAAAPPPDSTPPVVDPSPPPPSAETVTE